MIQHIYEIPKDMYSINGERRDHLTRKVQHLYETPNHLSPVDFFSYTRSLEQRLPIIFISNSFGMAHLTKFQLEY